MADDGMLVTLTADIVAAHVSNHSVAISEIYALIGSVHASLSGLANAAEQVAALKVDQKPAVSIRASIKPDYLICLEDGAKVKLLKGYLRKHFGMTPENYRAKWNLPKDYPMVPPNYAARRREIAKEVGLGRLGISRPAKTSS
jgi:predicted transcriptional regulator